MALQPLWKRFPLKPYNPFRYLTERREMTFILGSRCSDGVVLVGDRRVITEDGTFVAYRDKIFGQNGAWVWGSSGIVNLYGSFNDRVSIKLQRFAQVNRQEFFVVLEEAFEEMTRLSNYYENQLRWGNLQVLMAIRAGATSTLHLIKSIGRPTQLNGYQVIGSGEPYGSIFLREYWMEDMTMNQVAEIGYFIIKYIEEFELDNAVGVGVQKPQVWFIPDNPPSPRIDQPADNTIRQATSDELNRMDNRTEERLNRFEKALRNLWDIPDVMPFS